MTGNTFFFLAEWLNIDVGHFQGGRESMGNKIYLSGPLMVSSSNMDQMLKEHDRKIQEFSRRARIDKSRARGEKVFAQRK